MLSRLVTFALCTLLAACASTPRPDALIPVGMAAPGAKSVNIHVATSRGIDPSTGLFNTSRARQLHFQNLVVSVPPTHKAGEIEWPQASPGNPATSFVTTANQMLDAKAFLARLEANLPPSREVIVFVHGYNTRHEEGVFRLTQMVADAGMPHAAVLFSWPSRGEVLDYVTDRESVTASRNQLHDLLRLIASSPKVKSIDILAHSMGNMLTVDTIMMAKLRGDADYSGKLHSLVLAAPDIDVDVFLAQFEIIGKRNKPTIILTSRDDRALAASRKLAGDVVRVGAASVRAKASVEAIERLGLTVFDLTQVEAQDRAHHGKFASAAVLERMKAAKLATGLGQQGQGQPVGSFILDTAGAILEAPGNALRQIAR